MTSSLPKELERKFIYTIGSTVRKWERCSGENGKKHRNRIEDEAVKRLIEIFSTAINLAKIELAEDIKHRHWVNDKLRDAYLDAVINVAKKKGV